MADLTFNTTAGQTIAREMMIAYLNTGTNATPVWSAVGKRVTDSSMEMDWGEETSQDILGESYTKLKKPVITQTFDPVELDSGDTAAVKLWNTAIKDQDYNALAAMDFLIVHFYAGTASTPFAERYEGCTVRPNGLGGEGGGTVGMPFDVSYGGKRTVGKASRDATTGAVSFTPDVAPDLPKLSAFSITNASFSFDADVNSYSADASSSSGTVTATAATQGSTVVILANGNSIASGGSVSWADGDNLISVTVSYGGRSNTYEAHITYDS